eukprot:6211790-Pleurochrysis_carterae.AAC.5
MESRGSQEHERKSVLVYIRGCVRTRACERECARVSAACVLLQAPPRAPASDGAAATPRRSGADATAEGADAEAEKAEAAAAKQAEAVRAPEAVCAPPAEASPAAAEEPAAVEPMSGPAAPAASRLMATAATQTDGVFEGVAAAARHETEREPEQPGASLSYLKVRPTRIAAQDSLSRSRDAC